MMSSSFNDDIEIIMADEQVDVGTCDQPHCRDQTAASLSSFRTCMPTNNDVVARREQRDFLLDCVEAAGACNNNKNTVNAWWAPTYRSSHVAGGCDRYDDLLANPDGTTTSLTMDALLRFGGRPDIRLSIFTPNTKPEIVEHLHRLPRHTTDGRLYIGTGCACRFNDRWAAEMRARGGLDVVLLDGYGGGVTLGNTVAVLKQLVDGRVFRHCDGERSPVRVMVVFHDGEEFQSPVAAIQMLQLFRGTPYVMEVDSHEEHCGGNAMCFSMAEPAHGARRARSQPTAGLRLRCFPS